ncbi:SDR family oxidoreductase [Pseudobacteroides cellulosolvens]|uniref:3-oxoacyl-(Acyl-carrier-protein) reductase n=1 Tax=Pseudobacteroides cellulosolvens ATCC 35603 = DSM 2933 TaxID=398512 RepID=A0A0L6JSJ7_9FIRM|nr:SDR family oxidoreductase [Pseudobacteroides cellulosolvens]KNY28806.1 3-oxoacyl-(acyl-carrier-protein) reductase [Pseudobacteroides cellulosolvens ATCC 35603 = DSM 2933]
MDFNNRVCVVTGGAGGIGLCISREFKKRGAKIAIIDKDKIAGEKILEELTSDGSECIFFHGDISEKSALESFADEILKTFRNVDYLINNACISNKGILSGCDYDDFNYVLKVGVTAPYMLSKLFRDYFSKDGCIVNISSTRAVMSQADTESYTAAKGGISALTHALAVSLAGKVRVNSVSPGWIDVKANFDESYYNNHSSEDKNQHLVKRIGIPFDIARTVMFLCHPDSGFITGQNITVDGGMTKLMIYNGDDGWEYKN